MGQEFQFILDKMQYLKKILQNKENVISHNLKVYNLKSSNKNLLVFISHNKKKQSKE